MPANDYSIQPTSGSYVSGLEAAVYITSSDPTIHQSITNRKLDIITLEFTETQEKLPIYGYKSEEWDTVLRGEKLVQGTFSLNMKSALQLTKNLGGTVYSRVQDSITNLPLARHADAKGFDYWYGSESTEYTDLFGNLVLRDRPVFTQRKQIPKISFDIKLVYSSIKMKLFSMDFSNPDEEDIVNKYMPFLYSKSITIKNVMVNSIQQSIAPDGAPIGEFYSFIGKNVIEKSETPKVIKRK